MTAVPGSSSGPGSWLEKQWYRLSLWQLILLPLSMLFRLLSFLRRVAYRLGWLPSERLPVPVVVVGNISVGGTGKTPLVLWLTRFLRQQGLRPGIVSRGYGGSSAVPQPACPDSDATRVGDEPVLLAAKSGCPVWVGRDRVAAGRALLSAHPECDVIVSDDGLQHYRLRRDAEVVVVDGQRRFGNGCLLPAGPLREGTWRLRSVDAVVVNGGGEVAGAAPQYEMRLHGGTLRNLRSGDILDAAGLAGKKIHAVAGIGHPQRFFDHLRGLGLEFEAHAFPDHYVYGPADLDWHDAAVVLMTEKDAVKCNGFATERYWALAVEAEVDPGFGVLIMEKIRGVK